MIDKFINEFHKQIDIDETNSDDIESAYEDTIETFEILCPMIDWNMVFNEYCESKKISENN